MRPLVPPLAPPSLAVADSDARFPVRRIYCVGQNYADHAKEMGGDPTRNPPFFFAKPADAIVADGATVPYPPATRELHHEVELVVALGGGGRSLDARRALDGVAGYAVGLDLTRRDLQREAKKDGRPWDMAKGFDASAPVGALRLLERGGHAARGRIRLTVNGAERQRADLSDMIWPVGEVLAALSRLVELRPGDIVFTGTPAGVGPLAVGDVVEGTIEEVGSLRITIGPPRE